MSEHRLKRHQSKLIMGSAIGLATILVAIDHTRHSLPTPEPAAISDSTGEEEMPCGLDSESPCGMDAETPCGLDAPCSMDSESPCGMGEDETPCGLD